MEKGGVLWCWIWAKKSSKFTRNLPNNTLFVNDRKQFEIWNWTENAEKVKSQVNRTYNIRLRKLKGKDNKGNWFYEQLFIR